MKCGCARAGWIGRGLDSHNLFWCSTSVLMVHTYKIFLATALSVCHATQQWRGGRERATRRFSAQWAGLNPPWNLLEWSDLNAASWYSILNTFKTNKIYFSKIHATLLRCRRLHIHSGGGNFFRLLRKGLFWQGVPDYCVPEAEMRLLSFEEKMTSQIVLILTSGGALFANYSLKQSARPWFFISPSARTDFDGDRQAFSQCNYFHASVNRFFQIGELRDIMQRAANLGRGWYFNERRAERRFSEKRWKAHCRSN